jgi:hypothetical protein
MRRFQAVCLLLLALAVQAWQPAQLPALARSPRTALHALRCAAEDGPAAEEGDASSSGEAPTTGMCPSCGRPTFAGCDGNGRVMGGLAAIPLFEWWPIKAYRPCPEGAKAGMRYSRSGQSLDEIVFKKNPKGGYYGDDD